MRMLVIKRRWRSFEMIVIVRTDVIGGVELWKKEKVVFTKDALNSDFHSDNRK